MGHLYLSGVWLGVDLRTNPKKKDMCLKQIELSAQNSLTILVNRIGEHHMMISKE